MKLELTTVESLTLLKAAYLADLIANAHASGPTEIDWDIARLRRKIFKQAAESGLEDMVTHEPGSDDYTETEQLAEDLDAAVISKHIDMTFWRELATRLSEGIMDKKYGVESSGWNDERYERHFDTIQKKVELELQTNGLSNLFLLGDF